MWAGLITINISRYLYISLPFPRLAEIPNRIDHPKIPNYDPPPTPPPPPPQAPPLPFLLGFFQFWWPWGVPVSGIWQFKWVRVMVPSHAEVQVVTAEFLVLQFQESGLWFIDVVCATARRGDYTLQLAVKTVKGLA